MKREIIVPVAMKSIVERAGYAPAVRVGNLVFCAGQVGRDANLNVTNDPERQFEARWDKHSVKRIIARVNRQLIIAWSYSWSVRCHLAAAKDAL